MSLSSSLLAEAFINRTDYSHAPVNDRLTRINLGQKAEMLIPERLGGAKQAILSGRAEPAAASRCRKKKPSMTPVNIYQACPKLINKRIDKCPWS
jgi:hypothetical protein